MTSRGMNYLRRENGGLPITERESFFSEKEQIQAHKMSDGFLYGIKNNKWVCLD